MHRVTALACTLLVGACATAPSEPQLSDEESFDGLHRVTNSRISQAWIRSDLDLAGYTAVLPVYAGTSFVATKSANARSAGGRAPFPISTENRERLDALVKEVLGAALQKSTRFSVATAPGPNVLTVVSALTEIISNVPPQPIGRGDVYLSQVGSATLVVELRDSESNEVLARFFDRRAAGSAMTGTVPSSPPRNAAEIRALLTSWGDLLRQRLDEVPSLTQADD